MNWLETVDGEWINLNFVTQLAIIEDEDILDGVTYCVYATTYCMHEEIAHIIFNGSEADCKAFLKGVVENVCRS